METSATALRSTMDDDVEEILLTHEQIQSRVAELGAQLAADYAEREPVLVSVLKGSPATAPRPSRAARSAS